MQLLRRSRREELRRCVAAGMCRSHLPDSVGARRLRRLPKYLETSRPDEGEGAATVPDFIRAEAGGISDLHAASMINHAHAARG